VNKHTVMKGVGMALLVASPWAGAGSNYPAPFEPKVLYQDRELIEQHSQAAQRAPQSAPPATTQSAPPAATPVANTEAPSRYPAPFEPKVLYQDRELIEQHSQVAQRAPQSAPPAATPAAPQSAPAVTTPAPASAPADTPASPSQAQPAGWLVQDYLIGALVLGLLGSVLWTLRRSGARGEEALSAAGGAAASAPPADTGVARYLKSQTGAETETGVAKYLKSLPESAKTVVAETGVAKYLKNLSASR
jgi:hypothetical protein